MAADFHRLGDCVGVGGEPPTPAAVMTIGGRGHKLFPALPRARPSDRGHQSGTGHV